MNATKGPEFRTRCGSNVGERGKPPTPSTITAPPGPGQRGSRSGKRHTAPRADSVAQGAQHGSVTRKQLVLGEKRRRARLLPWVVAALILACAHPEQRFDDGEESRESQRS